MKFNINYCVRVRLTDYGKEILNKRFDELHARFPSVFREFALPKEDSEGWSKWQMWSLMKTFGNYINLDDDVPFETEIEIVENQT